MIFESHGPPIPDFRHNFVKMLCKQSYKRIWAKLFKSFPSLSTTDGFRDLDNCVASVKLLISRLIDLSSSSSGSTKSSISEDKSTSSR